MNRRQKWVIAICGIVAIIAALHPPYVTEPIHETYIGGTEMVTVNLEPNWDWWCVLEQIPSNWSISWDRFSVQMLVIAIATATLYALARQP